MMAKDRSTQSTQPPSWGVGVAAESDMVRKSNPSKWNDGEEHKQMHGKGK